MTQLRLIKKTKNPKHKTIMQVLNNINSSSIGYFIVDLQNNTIEFTRQSLSVFPIKQADKACFSGFFSFVNDVDIERTNKVFEEIVHKTVKNNAITCSVETFGEMPVWINSNFSYISGKSSEDDYILGVLENVSNETNYKLIVESCLDGTFIADLSHNHVIFEGKLFDELLIDPGYYPDARKILNNIVYSEDKEYYNNYLSFIIDNMSERNRIEYRMYGKDYRPIWVSSRNKVFFNEDKKPVMAVGGYININDLKSYNKYLESSTETCEITNMYNRYKMFKDLNHKANSTTENGYIIFINIDDYKNLSNIFEYEEEKSFLREIGNILKKNADAKSSIYHNETENFVLIMPEVSENEALEQMRHYQTVTGAPFDSGNIKYPYSISMVAVAYNEKTIHPEEVLKKCNIAIKKIQMEGKNKYIVFKKKIAKEFKEKTVLENKLRQSVLVDMQGFFVMYQPFIQAKTSRCIGAEALLRWKDEQDIVLSPTVFIPILENLGLMDKVGEWVFQQSANQCKEWLDKGFDPDFYVSVNVSTPQLNNKKFSSKFLNYLKEICLPTKNIVIEITESVLMMDFQHGMKQLNALKKHGVKLALDDFGTGYSSLSYLRHLPVDEVKIDNSFIQDIESNAFSREFVASIIKITQSIGRVACLEGVESSYQMELLKQMDCDIFQGFLFGRPQNPLNLEHLFHYYNADECEVQRQKVLELSSIV